ncbi:MAG: hypothetical protein JKY15_07665 [Deltaproteobacteria bacterium]|nr:hypothetical protein [Deltaproteobacteria bacterium]
MGRSTRSDLLGCSRRSIYRALKQLKEQGYLAETKKRQNRCKVYLVQRLYEEQNEVAIQKDLSTLPGSRFKAHDDVVPSVELPHFAQFFLKHCYATIASNMDNFPEWEKFLPEATHKLRHIEKQDKFWRLMFDNLYLIQERETAKPCTWARLNNPDSTLYGVPYPKEPLPENIEHRMRTVPAYRPLR